MKIMALRKDTNAQTSGAQFEEEDLDMQMQASEATATSAQATAAADAQSTVSPTLKGVVEDEGKQVAVELVDNQPSTSTAVAAAPAKTALVKTTAKAVALQNVLSDMKDAFRVEFDSLPRMIAEQGSMVMKEGAVELGTWVKLKMLSYQDSWVCSPNDNKAPKELVKFSEDGKVDRDGLSLHDHLMSLREQGYTKAKISHRLVVVGELLETANGEGPLEDLVQIDLSDTGRKSFNTYTLQASYKVAKGKFDAEDATILKMTAAKARSANNEVYTKVDVSVAAEAAAKA